MSRRPEEALAGSRVTRLGGRGRRDDGAVVTWTIADGRKGRRWREIVERDGAILHGLLYETDTERRFSHLELASPAGLATLHPEADGTLHGNRVDASGVAHVRGLAQGDAPVLVLGSPVAAAAVAWWRDAAAATRVTLLGGRMVVLDPSSLLLADASSEAYLATVACGADGRPSLLEGVAWPLEVPPLA